MSTFATLDEAKTHLRLPLNDTTPDADLTAKLAVAEAHVMGFINATPERRALTATWDASTVPLPIKHAILIQTGEFWLARGDDPEPIDAEGAMDLSPSVQALIRLWQPKVIA